jgi:hypothetical protein
MIDGMTPRQKNQGALANFGRRYRNGHASRSEQRDHQVLLTRVGNAVTALYGTSPMAKCRGAGHRRRHSALACSNVQSIEVGSVIYAPVRINWLI